MRKLSTDLIKSGSFTGSFSGSVVGTITSASFASTASYLLNSFSLNTGSSYPITSSWSNKSITSSYSITSSNLSPVAQDLIPFTSSTYSLGSPTNKWKDLYVSTGSIYIGDTVLSTSGSTLYTNTSPVVTLNTASGQIEISGISASLSASYATNAGLLNNTSSTIFATTGSNNFNGNQTVQGNITIVGSLTAQQYVVSSSVSYFTSSNFDGSTKFGDTDSDTHQFTGSLRSPNITGSLLGTSSFSNNSTSASYSGTASVALVALTSSYINVATNAVSSSFASTSSYNLNSVSSSYSLTTSFASNAGTLLTTGSTYPITASWSNNSISSSYSTFAVSATSATSATSANTSTSASYATVAGSATSATSATSANSATSASYSLSSSYSVNSTTAISSSFASTASYNLNSISSSFSTNATTASYVVNSVSSSYALTASYALNAGSGGTTLTTGSTYPITSSWANNVITASYAMNGGSGGGSTPVVSVASLNNQTILYNFSSSQEATITGLTLTNNNWGINVVEEWDAKSITGGDEYYTSCSLLLHFSGSNNSTVFVDNSPVTKSLISNNGAKITSSISKFGGSSLFLDGTDDYVTVTNSTDFDFGSGDFTIEYWEYRTNTTNQSPILSRNTITYTPFLIGWYDASSNPPTNGFYASSNGSSWDIASHVSMGTMITNSWTHYAVTRNGNTFRTFQNGIQISTFTSTATLPAGTETLQIGRFQTTYYFKGGYIDELRITKGVARYTGSFATSSNEFPNAQFLTQLQTKYIGLVGGINDSTVDYGVEKLSDTSLKIRKMSASGQPLSGSGALSASVDRIYVNVLNYTNVSVGSPLLGQTFTAVGSTSSYALSRSVVNPYEIVVAVDGAVQAFNNAYTVTSSTINFTESIPSGSLVDIRFLTTPNVNSASYALTSSYALNGGSVNSASYALTSSYTTATASYSLTSSNIFGGTRNYVPLWSGTTTLSSSIIYQSGSNIGIGTINPPALLSVSNSLDDVRINNGSGLSSIRIYGYNQAGGAGFTGFLELQNTFASATNSKKFFRLNSTGTIEIINNAYTTAIFSLTDAGVLSTPGGGTSDVRKKQNIEYIIDDATPIINQFKPVVFEFIEHGGVKRHGFIAQDVLTFKPDLVLGDGDKTDGTYGLDYDGILSLTVKSLQEANKKIKDLESTVNILIEEVNNLKSIIEKN